MANANDNAQTQKKDTRTPMDRVISDLPENASTSAKIRALDAANYTRSEIAKHLGKRYQHVRNVLVTPLQGDKSKGDNASA